MIDIYIYIYICAILVQSGSDQGSIASGTHRPGSSTTCNPSSVVTAQRGYLASVMLDEKGIGSELCPWIIQAESGQTVTLTVFDFGQYKHRSPLAGEYDMIRICVCD